MYIKINQLKDQEEARIAAEQGSAPSIVIIIIIIIILVIITFIIIKDLRNTVPAIGDLFRKFTLNSSLQDNNNS